MSTDNINITGYQYSPKDGKYIGVYVFPNNMDKEEIHLPPFTTLIEPPLSKPDFELFWINNEWVYKPAVVSNIVTPPPIGDYAMLMESFIDELKNSNRWTEEDQRKREAAIIKEAQRIKPSEQLEIDAANLKSTN
jgi:hypothetical protein